MRTEQYERPNEARAEDDVTKAYRLLQSERGLLYRLTKGNEELLRIVMDEMTQKLVRHDELAFNIQDFLSVKSYRMQIYRNTVFNALRSWTARGGAEVAPVEDEFFQHVPESSTPDPETVAVQKDALDKLLGSLTTRTAELVRSKRLTERDIDLLIALIKGVLADKSKADIARELDIHPPQISKLLTKVESLLPEFSYLWDIIRDKGKLGVVEKARDTAQKSFDHEKTTLRSLIDTLSAQEELTPMEQAMLIVAQGYVDPRSHRDMVKQRLADMGFSTTEHFLDTVRKKINEAVGRNINYQSLMYDATHERSSQ